MNVSVTGILQKNGKYLICKRALTEKAFPGMWCVPGGKLEVDHIKSTDKDTKHHWFNVFELTLKREIKEETGLDFKNTGFLKDLFFIRSDGKPTLIVSMYADAVGEEVTLCPELTDYAWVSPEELSNYNLIQDIPEQIKAVHKIYNNR